MKKYILFLSMGIALTHSGQSNAQTFKQKYFKDVSYFFDDLQKIKQSELFTIHKTEFGLSDEDEMVQTNNVVSIDGKFTTKYVLFHKGIPVEGSMMNVIGDKGIVQYANGFLLTGLNIDKNNIISEQQAIDAAIASVNSEKFLWEDTLLEAAIKEETNDPNATNYPSNITLSVIKNRGTNLPHTAANYQLCYQIPIISLIPSFHKIIYINANDGSVYSSSGAEVEDYSTIGTLWTAHNGWHNDMITNTCTFCSNFRLIDVGKNLKTGSSLSGIVLKDGNNNWVESNTKTGASAHWALQKTWDYYLNRHGRAGSNYNRKPVVILTEKSMNDGMNLYYDASISSEDRIYIRPNTPSGHSAAMLDVVAHEYTHAMIKESSNLGIAPNDFDAKSIAEGYADIFGMKIEGDVLGTHDWTFAENMGTYKRNFADPHADFGMMYTNNGSNPGASASKYLDPGYWSSVNPQANGGVLRKWFYLLSNGGTFNGNTVLPIGIETSTDIAYITFNWWLWSNLQYPEMAKQTVYATIAHWGTCSNEHKQVVKAFRAVGFNIPNPYCFNIDIVGPGVVEEHTRQAVEWRAKLNEIGDLNGSYQWNIPSDWDATVQDDRLVLNSHKTSNSQQLSVTYTTTDGKSYTDTIIVHFSDVTWQPTNNMPQTLNHYLKKEIDSKKGLTLSPNPATQYVQIYLNNFEDNAKIELLDINGRLIATYNCNQPQFEINVSGLANGLYILRAKMDGHIFTQKLSIAH